MIHPIIKRAFRRLPAQIQYPLGDIVAYIRKHTLIYLPLPEALFWYRRNLLRTGVFVESWRYDGLITIAMPCYGHADVVEDTLKSIESQTRLPDQVILVNDCSPDDMFRKLEQWSFRDHPFQVKIINNESNLGQCASLNRAIAATSTSLITVLNDDDILFPDHLQKVDTFFRTHPEIFLLGTGAISFQGEAPPTFPSAQGIRDLPFSGRNTFGDVRFWAPDQLQDVTDINTINMVHSGMSFSKAAWEIVGGYRPAIRASMNRRAVWAARRIVWASDRDFQLRVAAMVPIAVSNEPSAFWRSDRSVDIGLNS